MARKLRFSPEARKDLRNIWRHVAADDRKAADRVARGIEARCASLEDRPWLGRSRSEFGPELRSLLVERWLAFYRIGEEHIDILRILDSARDLKNIDWPIE